MYHFYAHTVQINLRLVLFIDNSNDITFKHIFSVHRTDSHSAGMGLGGSLFHPVTQPHLCWRECFCKSWEGGIVLFCTVWCLLIALKKKKETLYPKKVTFKNMATSSKMLTQNETGSVSLNGKQKEHGDV